ncbi:MAG: ORF6N domain-containing protein [Ferruginibacter sp.]
MEIIQSIQNRIYELRREMVMLDRDLAILYEIETRVLNQSVKRNIKRFPDDFMFQLTQFESEQIKSQLEQTSN